MSDQHPPGHISDAQKLVADGQLYLYELTPSVGTGTFRFKEGADATWLTNLYQGLAVTFSGDKMTSDGQPQLVRLTIGGDVVDLTALKPILFDGSIDGGLLVQRRILTDDLVNNRNITFDRWYRIKRPEEYSGRKVTLILATYASSFGSKLPYRQFTPPSFPFVTLK